MSPLLCLAALLPAALQQPVRADRDARMVNAALTVAFERHALPALKGSVSLAVQTLLAEVEIVAPSDAPAIANALRHSGGALCPSIEVRGNSVVLTCRTRRIEAGLAAENGRRYLDLRQLRGLPYLPAEDGPPAFSYEPRAVGIGGPCPGTTPASRGECRLAAGAPLEAAALFKDALSTGERSFAAMRLGDLALVAHDPGTAVGWYQRAGPRGIFGRMANARLCELTGDCADKPGEAYFAVGLPEPLSTEMELRAVRAAALSGHFGEAAGKLAARLGSVLRPPACARAPVLCRRIALVALRQGTREDMPAAMALYLALPGREKGPLSLDLGRAAAERSAELGAPAFGANLLSALSRQIPYDELSPHLQRIVELFLAGGDRARAQVILDYARSRLGTSFSSEKWSALEKELARAPSESPAGSDAAEKERALVAQAVAASKKAIERARALPRPGGGGG